MADPTVGTDIFDVDGVEQAVVLLLCRRRYEIRGAIARDAANNVVALFDTLREEGWSTSVAGMFGDACPAEVYETGFAHDIDVILALEAPTMAAAYHGADRLEQAGWSRLFRTEWNIGRREFSPVPSSRGRDATAPWNMFALWEWNDAWQAATPEQRREYDIECDRAFRSDIDSGVSIAGRHRLDAQSTWHHLGMWEAPTFGHITDGIAVHEEVADLMFTTSRHYVGHRRLAADYFGAVA
ncbi:hypothetical protein ACWDTP_13425 [Mycobacterium sp. NPDC003449]